MKQNSQYVVEDCSGGTVSQIFYFDQNECTLYTVLCSHSKYSPRGSMSQNFDLGLLFLYDTKRKKKRIMKT